MVGSGMTAVPCPPDVLTVDAALWHDRAHVDPVLGADRMMADAAVWITEAGGDPAAEPPVTVVYEVRRVSTPWGWAIEAEVLRGYAVVASWLRAFAPWDGAVPFATVNGRLVATVVGVGAPGDLDPWSYGIWLEGIPIDSHDTADDPGPWRWLSTRLDVDGVPTAGGSVPA
jgi:hypothetical protein